MPPELMHSQLLGTVKLLVDNWTNKLKANHDFGLSGNCIDTINRRLSSIKFPINVLRIMPDITSKLKSIEYEIILYYAIVAFDGILPNREYNLFKILSFIVSTLSNRLITQDQIEVTSSLIVAVCWPRRIWSDNGSNYLDVKNKIDRLQNQREITPIQ
ncbi:hypothetical protein BLOT_001557 [Blomia tropicalis]|nr:hypothetical protein BLOT_001557 [Blomia tropicalis]